MRALLAALALLAAACGGAAPYSCDETGFAAFESELPLDCEAVQRDTRIALAFLVTPSTPGAQAYPFTLDLERAAVHREALPREALIARFREVSVVVRASQFVCEDADGCFYALSDSIELASSMRTLAHEMLHAWEQRDADGKAGAVRLGGHHRWSEKGYNALAETDGLFHKTIEDMARQTKKRSIMRVEAPLP